MNKKLILRAAIKYRNWLIKQSETASMIKKTDAKFCLEKIIRRITDMDSLAKRFLDRMQPRIRMNQLESDTCRHITNTVIPNISEDVILEIQCAVEVIKSIIDQQHIVIITLQEAIAEITAISSTWATKFRGNTLSVKIPDIVLDDGTESVELGSFWVNLNIDTYSIRIESIDEIKSSKGFFHPHVSATDNLCSGDGGIPMKAALIQGRLEDYFRLVEGVLRTYNNKSPYEHLTDWYAPEEGEYCMYCEERRDKEDVFFCDKCNKTYCSECYSPCGDCGNSICPNCGLDACTECDQTLCRECSLSCKNCGGTVCNDCTTVCVHCNNYYCTGCIAEECHECKEYMCIDCQNICSECDHIICNSCAEDSCQHCGTIQCKSCKDEHNCILEPIPQ